MKEDEKKFLEIMQKEGWIFGALDKPDKNDARVMPRRIIERESTWLNEKRALYLLKKWEEKGWYEYGTVIDGGWLTEKGLSIDVSK